MLPPNIARQISAITYVSHQPIHLSWSNNEIALYLVRCVQMWWRRAFIWQSSVDCPEMLSACGRWLFILIENYGLSFTNLMRDNLYCNQTNNNNYWRIGDSALASVNPYHQQPCWTWRRLAEFHTQKEAHLDSLELFYGTSWHAWWKFIPNTLQNSLLSQFETLSTAWNFQ